jgi:hypothetical protein
MSLWRSEASKRLPELQGEITSTMIENPADLWMELRLAFDRLCHEEPPPVELLSRIWDYAKWSMDHKSDDVQFAVTAFFFTKIKDTRLYRIVLPTFMSVKEYEQVCGLHAPQTRKETS